MDFGTDAPLSARYAREHALALQALRTGNISLGSDLKHGSLEELRNRGVTCTMLAQQLPWAELARRFGVQQLIDAGFTWRDMMASGFSANDLNALTYAQLQRLGVRANDVLECRPALQQLGALRLHASELQELGFLDVAVLRDGFGATPSSLRSLGLSLDELHKLIGEPVDWCKDLGFTDFRGAEQAGWPADDLYRVAFKRVSPAPPAAAALPPPELADAQVLAALEAPDVPAAPPPALVTSPLASAPRKLGKLVF